MAGSLKSVTSLGLYGLLAANLAIFYAVMKGATILATDSIPLARDIGGVLPVGVGLALTGILNAQLSAETKSRIVFLRWDNALPGCEAFTRFAKSDLRVDIGSLQRRYGPLPTAPRDQNALWYRLYKSVDSEPAVQQVHRAFLFTRDYACQALMMMIVLGTAGFLQFPSKRRALLYLMILALQFVLAGQAARNHARRFVTTVLAIKGAVQ